MQPRWPEVAAEARLLPAPTLARQEEAPQETAPSARNRAQRGRRAFKMNRASNPQAAGGELINCLSEFFASRNVINRCDRYEQLRGEPAAAPSVAVKPKQQRQQQKRRQQRQQHQFQVCDSARARAGHELASVAAASAAAAPSCWPDESFHPAGWLVAQPSASERQPVKRLQQLDLQQAAAARRVGAAPPPPLAEAASKRLVASARRKCGVFELLKELMSGRRKTSRLALLGKLMRAPVVLAALFSLALALTLLSLYALSFRHCQHGAHLAGAVQGANSSVPPASHTISSRHLSGAAQSGARTSELQSGPSTMQASGETGASKNRQKPHAAESTGPARVRVQTECGVHEAQRDGAGLVFARVPYALPPVGERRWRLPEPIWRDADLCRAAAAGASNATRAPADQATHCVQLSPFNRRVSGSEDCLYLDIYAPQNFTPSQAQLPVMLYIHGGFLAYGSNGAESRRAPSAGDEQEEAEEDAREEQVNWMRARPSGQLASELGVLLVAANFRLQALGFMALEQLEANGGAPPPAAAANFGLWDQVVALNWLWRNIGHFGGRRDNINLFGPDAASALPLALVTRGRTAAAAAPGGERALPNGLELEAGELLRSVWLMNPAVYFELPQERARRHYARLIRSQSICSRAMRDRTTGGGGQAQVAAAAADLNATAALRDCLLRLPSAEVTREYLGKDDADFRLDDENSLPLRNIQPDQFVSLDGTLVQRSFPFDKLEEVAAAAAQQSGRRRVKFLLGSSGQAAEFWPCPRNLHQWRWPDFERYVATSLNSFSADTYKLASALYEVPIEPRGNSSRNEATAAAAGSPAETYLTMVSDIRQICPANELAASLAHVASGPIGRYLIEWRPSERLAASLSASSGAPAGERRVMIDRSEASELRPTAAATRAAATPPGEAQRKVQFAFHHWDLLAFFGFQFERPQLEVAPRDLEFQRHLRALVRAFVHDDDAPPVGQLLFSRNLELERRDANAAPFRERECQMWRDSLGQSYAWLS